MADSAIGRRRNGRILNDRLRDGMIHYDRSASIQDRIIRREDIPMSTRKGETERILEEIFENFPNIRAVDIPGIDLYMDQVTTFLQDNLRPISRDPEGDKFLTKTMINNYVKNKVLHPPVKKKYSRDHMMLLIMIYYMKSFLSISDIKSITTPVIEYSAPEALADKKREASDKRRDTGEKRRESSEKRRTAGEQKLTQSEIKGLQEKAGTPHALQLSEIYDRIRNDIEEMLPRIHREITEQIELASGEFGDIPAEDRALLQRFSLICRLSAEVYVRKLLIEKILDSDLY